jgi:hypothetical protein
VRESSLQLRDRAFGTRAARTAGMAAVFCLVMLPALAAVGFMILAIRGDVSMGSAFAGATFFALATFVFASLYGMIKKAEDEPV